MEIPKANTKNKIAFCWACTAPLTRDNLQFCNDTCAAAWDQKRRTRDMGKRKEYVYLNKSMLDLAIGEGVMPHEWSAFIHTGHDMVGVALFDEGHIQSIPDAECNTYDAYYREIPRGESEEPEVNLEPHDGRAMREEGILGYLCDHFGIRTERKIAEAIAELCELENVPDPIELINTL